MAFRTMRIEYQHSGCPVCVETMEVSRMLFDVCFEGYEVFVYESSGYFISV